MGLSVQNTLGRHRVLRTVLRAWLLALLLIGASAQGMALAQQAPGDRLSDQARVSLLTILPGPQVHALFGHSALRFQDPTQGIDEIYNYGTFDFSDPFFVPKFMHGQMDYFLSVQPAYTIPLYVEQEGRPVIEQVLNLTPEQINTLYGFLQVNAQPENAFYRYDFIYDNCSTRILDVFQDNLGANVSFVREDMPAQSFRDLLEPYLAGQPFLHAGIDVLLGTPVDRVATPQEAAFLPDHLMYLFDEAAVEIDGEWQPLVAQTDTLEWLPGYERPEGGLPWPPIFGWLLLVAVVLVSYRRVYEGPSDEDLLARILDVVLYGLAGLFGLIIFYLWFISEHTVTGPNLNLLWAWPTHLIAAVALLRRSEARWLVIYLGAAAVATFMFLLLWPVWPQAFPNFVLPLGLALVVRSGSIVYARRKELASLQPV